jgi:SAM-dependent methyltransferase
MILGFLVEVLTGRTATYTLGIPLQLAREGRILELGFGSGDWLLGMRRIGYSNLHGYDIGSNDVNIRRLKRVGIDVITGDFVGNHYPDNYFDLVRLEHVFEHLLGPKDVLAKVYRLLKPGGVLVMSFPGSEGLCFCFSPQHCAYRDSPRHLALHTKQSAERMVRATGFNDISYRGFGVAVDLEAIVRNILIDRTFTAQLHFGAVIAPLYRTIAAALGGGDYIMIKAVK